MSIHRYAYPKYCRWCGNQYEAEHPIGKDGFCKPACKQAHYRAYKKYVTQTTKQKPGSQAKPVTHKKRKK